jgi:hypothetical protein
MTFHDFTSQFMSSIDKNRVDDDTSVFISVIVFHEKIDARDRLMARIYLPAFVNDSHVHVTDNLLACLTMK